MGNKSSSSSSPPPPPPPQGTGTQQGGGDSQKSYYGMAKDNYRALVHAIIRPPRAKYDLQQLGPTEFLFCEKRFQRRDFELENPRRLKIKCSMWEPIENHRQCAALPCVVYMHGNSSSRLESLSALSVILSLGACAFAFDFAGSGQSDGEYVSLGAFEKDDLMVVVQFLRNSQRISSIALWGRSMGAATALLHGDRDPSIAGMVLDSAFADLVMLAEELVEKGRQQGMFAPTFVVKLAIAWIGGSVSKAANFDIKLLSPIQNADKCFIPAMFICADNDAFVAPSHSQKIYEKYGGDKNIIIVEGDHNSARPKYVYDSVGIFLQNVMQIPDEWLLRDGVNFVRKLPWTYSKSDAMKRNKQLTADEQLALQLLEEDGIDIDQYAELVMQNSVEDSLFGLLSGGSHAPPPHRIPDASDFCLSPQNSYSAEPLVRPPPLTINGQPDASDPSFAHQSPTASGGSSPRNANLVRTNSGKKSKVPKSQSPSAVAAIAASGSTNSRRPSASSSAVKINAVEIPRQSHDAYPSDSIYSSSYTGVGSPPHDGWMNDLPNISSSGSGMPPHVERLGLHLDHAPQRRRNGGSPSNNTRDKRMPQGQSSHYAPTSTVNSNDVSSRSNSGDYLSSQQHQRSISNDSHNNFQQQVQQNPQSHKHQQQSADIAIVKSHLEAVVNSTKNIRPANAGQNGATKWYCGLCTVANPLSSESCEVCGQFFNDTNGDL